MKEPFATTTPPPRPRAAHAVHERIVTKIITFGALFSRAMTLGVRGLVLDSNDRVLLVRHTYVPGFYLPGGGVERGETMLQALARELQEEGGVHLLSAPALQGVYLNRRASPRDHVALYLVRHFHYDGPRAPDLEIAEAAFFPLDALPDDTTPATRSRIAEALGGEPVSPYW